MDWMTGRKVLVGLRLDGSLKMGATKNGEVSPLHLRVSTKNREQCLMYMRNIHNHCVNDDGEVTHNHTSWLITLVLQQNVG